MMDEEADVAESNQRATQRRVAVLCVVVASVTVAYWLAWFAHRSLVASSTSATYVGFEQAFPLADGWLVVCLLAAGHTLWRGQRQAVLWLLMGGGAGIYLFGMDVLYDLEHGTWTSGTNGLVELGINLATIGISAPLVWWTWTHRRALDPPGHPSDQH